MRQTTKVDTTHAGASNREKIPPYDLGHGQTFATPLLGSGNDLKGVSGNISMNCWACKDMSSPNLREGGLVFSARKPSHAWIKTPARSARLNSWQYLKEAGSAGLELPSFCGCPGLGVTHRPGPLPAFSRSAEHEVPASILFPSVLPVLVWPPKSLPFR
jgi:hypothetical protein